MKKFLKISLVLLYIIFFLYLIILQFWEKAIGFEYPTSYLIYWMVLIGWLAIVWRNNFGSTISLKTGFKLTLVGAVLVGVGLDIVGEIFLRVSFVCWLVGMIQALIEYKGYGKK